MDTPNWSEYTIKKTYEILKEHKFTPLLDDFHLKNLDDREARIRAKDVLMNNYTITLLKSDEKISFSTAEELVKAGWALD